MGKPRVLYILAEYPMDSQGYVRHEMESLLPDYDIKVISLGEPGQGFRSQQPYKQCSTVEGIIDACREFDPAIIHTHWMVSNLVPTFEVSKKLNIPFTVRIHSFDTLEWHLNGWFDRFIRRKKVAPNKIHKYVDIINDDHCIGALCFPFSNEKLEKAGIEGTKLTPCFPVSNFGKFYDTTLNGDRVLNFGATRPKKQFEDYIDLAKKVGNGKFDLFLQGSQRPYYAKIVEYNNSRGNPVNILEPIDPDDMPQLYKNYQWFVYTASMDSKSVGWPIAAAEAQAAGCGFCLPEIRPDVHDYLGDSAVIYRSIDELVDIVSNPVPASMREKGFLNAKKSDIESHRHLLTDLWDRVL